MTNLQSLSVFVTERLTLAAQEIFKAVEVTVTEYHEEISRSRQENELLKRRLLEAGIDLYPELQPSLSIIHDDEADAGQSACGEQWGQQSEEIQVKLELSAAQEETQDARPQIAAANESVSPKPCLQNDQKMEEMFHAQTTESNMDTLLLASPFVQVKEEPNELVSDLGSEALCDAQTCVSAYPNDAVASGHASGLGAELDSHRLSSMHKAARSKRWKITLPSQTPAIMEAILTLIRTTLPSLSEDRLQSLMHRLDAIGVGRFVDLRLVTAADLEGLLQPTQCRRLMEVFNSGPSDREPTQSAAGPMEPSASASEEFQIPWEKFPPELVKAMIEKTRPHPSLRREMVRIIIDDFLASKQKRPARDTLRQIARELVQKYPRSFCDLCGDSVVGPGFTCLLDQMENRVENCTRTLKRPAEGGTGAMQYDPYGCAQWQPDLPTTKDEPSQTDQKAELQNAYVRNSLPETYVRKLMAETYYSQRISINLNNKTVRELKDEWPYLFEATHFFEHTERLLGIPVQKRLGEEWSKKGKTVMNFFARTKVTPSNFQDPLELLSGIGKYLGDNTEVLLIKLEGINASTLSLPSTPCVVILGDERYLMAVDQTIVNDHVRCPLTALTYLFCLFYVLNIRYPKDAALSLEFIKSCLLGISPERGKETMQDVRHPKLLKFLSELNDYQNPWTV